MIDGTVEDISRSGVFFHAPTNLSSIDCGSATEIKLDLPGEATLFLAAEVVRIEAQPRPGLALRFVGEPERNRRPLANFIMRCHATS